MLSRSRLGEILAVFGHGRKASNGEKQKKDKGTCKQPGGGASIGFDWLLRFEIQLFISLAIKPGGLHLSLESISLLSII